MNEFAILQYSKDFFKHEQKHELHLVSLNTFLSNRSAKSNPKLET